MLECGIGLVQSPDVTGFLKLGQHTILLIRESAHFEACNMSSTSAVPLPLLHQSTDCLDSGFKIAIHQDNKLSTDNLTDCKTDTLVAGINDPDKTTADRPVCIKTLKKEQYDGWFARNPTADDPDLSPLFEFADLIESTGWVSGITQPVYCKSYKSHTVKSLLTLKAPTVGGPLMIGAS